jgi:hypothetical protein
MYEEQHLCMPTNETNGVLFNECSQIFLFTIFCNASAPKAMFEVQGAGAWSALCNVVRIKNVQSSTFRAHDYIAQGNLTL